ncbi:hypothetical protein [Limnohabitans sp.]|uniref:hypothetical protein n=1 Tax=Limnohabitans sp. TaxID=1907725 RepID=UPI0038BC2A5F
MIAKHEALTLLRRLHSRKHDVCGVDFDSVFGHSGKHIFRNAIGLRPRTFYGMFDKLMRESGLALNGAGQKRSLYSIRHT